MLYLIGEDDALVLAVARSQEKITELAPGIFLCGGVQFLGALLLESEAQGEVGDIYADGQFMKPPHIVSPQELQREIFKRTQQRLDDFASTRKYDGILSLCTYATSTNPTFSKEGQYGVNVRDATWSKLYQIMAEVEAGTRPMPTGYAGIEAELPALGWPV